MFKTMKLSGTGVTPTYTRENNYYRGDYMWAS